ncbi:S66 peptidase family protein [Parafilimonas sp.]|uniref:S66 peptidase family protein n=1 Tax=Parafilimonas sp. TaxID=1969739 RepID=UPI0039E2A85E
MAIIPPYLKPGDTIGMICPSGCMPPEKIQRCMNMLQQWGFTVKQGKTLGTQCSYFSGTDEDRLNDLQTMLDDEAVKAIFCARGGYGLSRIIDNINFEKFVQHPKWIIGYSDITLLLSHVHSNYNIASLHAPMASAFNDMEEGEGYIQSIFNSITGQPQFYTISAHALNRNGLAQGELSGGNLALLAHIVGSASDIDTKNKILFIEDIGEYLYNVDRMLLQLKRAGKLDGLAGFIVGRFADMKDTAIPFGQELYELIFDKVKEYTYPVCFGFPVGHVKENYALKVGTNFRFNVNGDAVTLAEQAG